MLDAFELLKSSPTNLTVDTLCKLHKTMMSRSRVLYANKGYEKRLEYVNIGVTRQVTASNVTVTVRATGMKVQFCPWDEIMTGLTVFCERFNVSGRNMQTPTRIADIGADSTTAGRPRPLCSRRVDQPCVRDNPPFRGKFASRAPVSTLHLPICQDGNGRLPRILASLPLVKRGFPRLSIPASQKEDYFVVSNNVSGDAYPNLFGTHAVLRR